MKLCRTAIELGSTHLRAVAITIDGGVAKIRSFVQTRRPDVPPEEVAAWIKQILDDAGIAKGRCYVAVPRQDAVIKRLQLVTPCDDELPEMVDLAMRDELHLDDDDVLIDFLRDAEPPADSNMLAAAIPAESLKRGRERATAAGRPLAAMSLRFLGTAALFGDDRGTCTACVDVGGDGMEFTLIRGSDVLVARSAPLPDGELGEIADAAGLEGRRTWMSLHVEADATVVDRVVVLGGEAIGEPVAAALRELTRVPVDRPTVHPKIQGPDEAVGCWPLAGLLLAGSQHQPLIDFAAPRKPRDVGALRRQWVLGLAGGLAVLLMIIWTIGNLGTRSMQRELDTLQSNRDQLERPWLRHHRDRYRLRHLDLWFGVQPDWPGHLSTVMTRLGAEGEVVLDEVAASVRYGGVDAPRREPASTWTIDADAQLVIEAEAGSHDLVEAFRARWVNDDGWDVETSGADTQDGRRLPFGVTIRMQAPVSPSTDSRESSP